MDKVVLPIDKKSLFLNIFNDHEYGHTATVSTPIKQGNSTNEKLAQIFKVPKQIDFNAKPLLVDELIKNSKSKIKINNSTLYLINAFFCINSTCSIIRVNLFYNIKIY